MGSGQWPQLGEVVRTAELVARVGGNFPGLRLEAGRAVRVTDYWGSRPAPRLGENR